MSLDEIHDLKGFLDLKVAQYNRIDFIENDPISVPHQFDQREDIEIAGLFSAVLSWGHRSIIIRKANELMDRMDRSPYQYIMGSNQRERQELAHFIHRTFNAEDAWSFCIALREIYSEGGLEKAFFGDEKGVPDIRAFRQNMLDKAGFTQRTKKHVPDIENGSAAKRINMFLRWMVRSDANGVDFGVWPHFHPRHLLLPLDVHSGRVARKLGLLKRIQDDFKAVLEITWVLQEFDPEDPCKYDFALFGLGAYEKF